MILVYPIPIYVFQFLCDTKVISRALLEIVNNVNLNKHFNHKFLTPIEKIVKCKNLDFDEHFHADLAVWC